MRKLLYSLLLMTCCLVPIQVFCEGLNKDVSWVKNCQGNRIYLNPDYLDVSEKGMFLIDEFGRSTPLSRLYSDVQGIYVKAESLAPELTTVWNIVWCRSCHNLKALPLTYSSFPIS